jgi:sorbitol/mannitol transport system substrate-binding protein
VAKEKGWNAVPTGTRKSTYANPEFLKAARFAEAEKKAIDSANPNDSTLPKSPYVGVQFAAIPRVPGHRHRGGSADERALAGKTTVDAALKASQVAADREMKKGRLLQVIGGTARLGKPAAVRTRAGMRCPRPHQPAR